MAPHICWSCLWCRWWLPPHSGCPHATIALFLCHFCLVLSPLWLPPCVHMWPLGGDGPSCPLQCNVQDCLSGSPLELGRSLHASGEGCISPPSFAVLLHPVTSLTSFISDSPNSFTLSLSTLSLSHTCNVCSRPIAPVGSCDVPTVPGQFLHSRQECHAHRGLQDRLGRVVLPHSNSHCNCRMVAAFWRQLFIWSERPGSQETPSDPLNLPHLGLQLCLHYN